MTHLAFLSIAPILRAPYYFFVSAWFGWQFAFAHVTFTFLFCGIRRHIPESKVLILPARWHMNTNYLRAEFSAESLELWVKKSSLKWERPCLPAMGINCFRCQQVRALKKAYDIQLVCGSRCWGRELVPSINVLKFMFVAGWFCFFFHMWLNEHGRHMHFYNNEIFSSFVFLRPCVNQQVAV